MQEQVVEAIRDARADLLAWLNDVGGEAWSAPTVCEGWSVKDVLAHMVEGEINVGRVYRGEQTEPGFIDPHEGVERWRALPGVAIRAALWQHGIASQRALEVMTLEAWERPINAFGCRRVSQLARLHLFDLAVHGHDLTDALGAPALWGPQLPFLVEYVVRAAPVTFRRRGLQATGSMAVQVTDGPSWTLSGDGPEWALREPGEATATLRTRAEDLVLITTGRDRGTADIEVDGDTAFAEQVLQAWRVV